MGKLLLALGSGAIGVSGGIVITLVTIGNGWFCKARNERILREREERRG